MADEIETETFKINSGENKKSEQAPIEVHNDRSENNYAMSGASNESLTS